MVKKHEPERVLRGGSWYDPRDRCRAAFRRSYYPDVRSVYFGFRLVSKGGCNGKET